MTMTSTALVVTRHLPATYKDVQRTLARLVRIDAVKKIRNEAIALAVYAYQAKDVELIGPATTARKMAERRIGELIADRRATGTLAKGAAERGVGRRGTRGKISPALRLADQGVDKDLAKRARAAAAMTETKFEADVKKAIKIAIAAIQHHKAVIAAARAESLAIKKAKRQRRERELADKLMALPEKKYGVIYADPEWKFETYSEDGMDRSAANHYPLSNLQEIVDRDIPSIAADDCVLFLWATVPMLLQALHVMAAWGFEYKSQVAWVKDQAGNGYWFRNQHELLLVGTRGQIPAPSQGDQWSSVIHAKRGKHSEKPIQFYQLIEAYFPNLPKIELNARKTRKGWDAWGNEVAEAAE